MKHNCILPIIAAALALNASAETTQKLSATKANDFAIVYSLPLTSVDITLETVKTVRTPGEFYDYAKRILNVDDPVSEPSVEYTLKSVTVTTHGVPDPARRYAVKFSSGSTPFMILSSGDVPLAVNTEETYSPKKTEIPVAKPAAPSPLQTEAARQVMSEDMLRSQSTLKRAQIAAEQLYALRQSRSDLLTGQADQMPPDGQAMQLVMDNLNAQEAALTAMFVGTEQVSTEVTTVTFTPSATDSDISRKVIARLSSVDGIVGADNLSGAPITLSYKVINRGEMPLNDKGAPLPFPKNGFAYCIPGTAKISVSYDGENFAETSVDIAQAGIDYGLAPNSFTDKRAPAYMIIDPATGAAIEIGTKK